jgi:exodeoxyribonuclease VII small subunit
MKEKATDPAKEKSELSFETALEGLEKSAEALKNEGTTLETALQSFEDGMAYYQRCDAILRAAKQKIELFRAEPGSS